MKKEQPNNQQPARDANGNERPKLVLNRKTLRLVVRAGVRAGSEPVTK